MADYRYLCTNLLTNQVIAELPLTGVTYSQALNEAGSFDGHMILSDIRTQQTLGTYSTANTFTLDNVTTTGKTGLYVERDGIIVWGGIIWSRQYDSASQTLSIGGREFESYYDRRRVNNDQVFAAGTDQFSIVNSLLTQANNQPSGNIGVVMQSPLGSSVGMPSAYPIWDNEKRTVFDVVRDLSRQSTPYGFDFAINCAYDSNKNLTRTFNLYYPRKGQSYSTNAFQPMLEFPGSMLYYAYPEDGGSMANRMYGAGQQGYVYTATNYDALAEGFPLLEDSVSFVQIPNPLVVNSMTEGEVSARALPVTVLTASWSPTTDPIEYGVDGQLITADVGMVFGSFQTGDVFRIRITDDRFPTTLETSLRLQKFDVRVGDGGTAEIINGSFVLPTY